ncbi:MULTISPECIES: ricin-type beta-trefoil lectin domain protein [unclassified Kitasatospora]|uniref:ricin-type beta-trefoil lectin domain protein n=1 Tax=unclassified Kitasatospora TaxID=2633591 RepID=UPI0033F0EBDA
MRRTAALFATALLAGAAAVTAPAAGAAESTTRNASADTTPGPGGVGSCTVSGTGWGLSGTCTGLDPQQTWMVGITCQGLPDSNGFPTYSYGMSGWVTGNTTATAGCSGMATGGWGGVSFGPAVPAGPVGQITGIAGKCLDVRGGSNANGTQTQIWDCLGNVNQTWKVGADGTVRAVGNCLDVEGGRTGNGTLVRTWECNGSGAQQWRPRADGSLVNPQSGRCLDVRGVSSANGAVLQIWDCFGATAANQIWHLPV